MKNTNSLNNRISHFKSISYILIALSLILFSVCIVLLITSLNKLLILIKPGQLTDMERFFLFSEIIYVSSWGIGCMITGSILLMGSLKILTSLK